ncbi:Mitochondrial distribution and morphology protein 12, partial [Ophidiomyces ophidiicola]
ATDAPTTTRLTHVMSIDINWEAATSGPDGEALAERIRSFVHDKFQQIALPRFIRSVEVNSFDFGTISPELQIKELCDPFEDFYEEDEEDGYVSSDSDGSPTNPVSNPQDARSGEAPWQAEHPRLFGQQSPGKVGSHDAPASSRGDTVTSGSLRPPMPFGEPLNSYFFPRAGTPGIPGGTSNLGYYMPLGGISGTQTPLPRGPFSPGLRDSSVFGDISSLQGRDMSRFTRRESDDIDSKNSRPSTSATLDSHQSHNISDTPLRRSPRPQSSNESRPATPPDRESSPPPRRMQEKNPEDLQVLCRMKYNGNIQISLTAQVLLDYPMPNFLGLPLKLNITGLTFDGVAVVAYIRKRVHFCFLSQEDADTLIGTDDNTGAGSMQTRNSFSGESDGAVPSSRRRDDSLLRDIRVESEIGRKEDGKQVLKNVGKVERFVLEQVRRIFEEEFVYPSFWTFLI